MQVGSSRKRRPPPGSGSEGAAWADRFAAETAEMLKRRAMANEFESLIVVAPPKMLGELRKHYHKEVTDRLVGELAKTLTNADTSQIEQAIVAA